MKKRIKILYRKNLKMTEGKLAAQCVHVALAIKEYHGKQIDAMSSVVVLGISDNKFEEAKEKLKYTPYVVNRDAGYTEVPQGTETCLAYVEDDPREGIEFVMDGK